MTLEKPQAGGGGTRAWSLGGASEVGGRGQGGGSKRFCVCLVLKFKCQQGSQGSLERPEVTPPPLLGTHGGTCPSL